MKVDTVALISFHTCPLAAPGEDKAGGMNVYVRELARHLGSLGIKVDMFTRCHVRTHGPNGHQDGIVDLGSNVRLVHLKGGPPGERLDALYSHLPAFLEDLHRFAGEQGIGYRTIHSHYWLSGWVGRRAADSWNVPHVITFHTLAAIKMQARAGERETPLRSREEKELIASSRLIIVSSPHEKEAMVRLYGAPEHRIEVVPCGVDLSLFRPLDIGEARKKLGLNGEKVIVYVGRIEPIKGLELLFHSAAIMEVKDSMKVLVIGGGTAHEAQVERLKGLVEELGIDHITEFVGPVDHRLLPLYYNAADVCVVPSFYESFGLAALEALACGTPVVASRVGGLATVVQHGRNGYLLSWRCPEPFADSLEVILSSRGLQKSMSLAARERAEGMGWSMVAEETSRLYDSL